MLSLEYVGMWGSTFSRVSNALFASVLLILMDMKQLDFFAPPSPLSGWGKLNGRKLNKASTLSLEVLKSFHHLGSWDDGLEQIKCLMSWNMPLCRKDMNPMNNPQLLAVLGELNRDPNMRPEWLWTVKASHSASCTYPVTGSLGTANLQVLAVLLKGTNPLSTPLLFVAAKAVKCKYSPCANHWLKVHWNFNFQVLFSYNKFLWGNVFSLVVWCVDSQC